MGSNPRKRPSLTSQNSLSSQQSRTELLKVPRPHEEAPSASSEHSNPGSKAGSTQGSPSAGTFEELLNPESGATTPRGSVGEPSDLYSLIHSASAQTAKDDTTIGTNVTASDLDHVALTVAGTSAELFDYHAFKQDIGGSDGDSPRSTGPGGFYFSLEAGPVGTTDLVGTVSPEASASRDNYEDEFGFFSNVFKEPKGELRPLVTEERRGSEAKSEEYRLPDRYKKHIATKQSLDDNIESFIANFSNTINRRWTECVKHPRLSKDAFCPTEAAHNTSMCNTRNKNLITLTYVKGLMEELSVPGNIFPYPCIEELHNNLRSSSHGFLPTVEDTRKHQGRQLYGEPLFERLNHYEKQLDVSKSRFGLNSTNRPDHPSKMGYGYNPKSEESAAGASAGGSATTAASGSSDV